MKKCESIILACPECEELVETKWFDDDYVVGVCKQCLCAATARILEKGDIK